jgi:hypothetical protein
MPGRPRSRDVLARFRPAGTPGAPAAAAVPADRVAERSAELEPVLARLEDTQVEAARLVDDARAEAGRRRATAAERAEALLAAAHRDAVSERADAAAAVRQRAEAAAADIAAEAEHEAAAVLEVAEQRAPALVARVVASVRADLGLPPGTASAGSTADTIGGSR